MCKGKTNICFPPLFPPFNNMYDGDDGDDGDGRRDPTLKARPPRAPCGANNDDDFDKPLGIFLLASRL